MSLDVAVYVILIYKVAFMHNFRMDLWRRTSGGSSYKHGNEPSGSTKGGNFWI